MNDISKQNDEPKISRFERFVALSNGQYWQANFTSEKHGITKGQSLLISQIDDVDNKPHTVHVRLHPSAIKRHSTTQKFLIDDFMDKFEHVESHVAEAGRERDLRSIQDKIKDSQDELNSAYTNPALMNQLIDKEMPKKTEEVTALPIKHEALGADIVGAVKSRNLVNLMSKDLTDNGVRQIKSGLEEQKDIAVRRSEWIQMRTNRLSAIANEMTPYFEEKAALQLALSKDMIDHVDELMKGIASLNLYVLKDVDILQLTKGADAPDTLPLTITQRVLYMDEELAVWEEIDNEFDYEDKNQFFEALGKHKALVEQIFPSERCVVSVATTRSFKDYQSKGYSMFEVKYAENANLCQYLLVRNGGNIHVVLSPDVFHRHSTSLFPTNEENEKPFRGWDGREITYNDLEYTSSLNEHAKIALGYKRLLILLCGLDHNKQLFGEFYKGQPSMDFVSQEFQEKHFNFIHDLDGEGLIATERPPCISEWVAQQNKAITSGCTVLIRYGALFDAHTIPAMFSRDGRSRNYQPKELLKGRYFVGRVERKKNKLTFKVPLKGHDYDYKERSFNGTFDLSEAMRSSYGNLEYIAIDKINIEEALWYLHDRPSRNLNVEQIRMLKQAIELAQSQKSYEKPVKDVLMTAIEQGKLAALEEASKLVDNALATWRCAKPTKDVLSLLDDKKALHAIMDQIFTLNHSADEYKVIVEDDLASEGRDLLRLSILSNGDFCAYATPLESERDDRITSFDWVMRIAYKKTQKGLNRKSTSFKHLVAMNTGETLVYEVDNIKPYLAPLNPVFSSPKVKNEKLETGKGGMQMLLDVKKLKDDPERIETVLKNYLDVRHEFTFSTNREFVFEPYACFEIGTIYKYEKLHQLCFYCEVSDLLAWACAGNQELEKLFISNFVGIYANKAHAENKAKGKLNVQKDNALNDLLSLGGFSNMDAIGFISDSEYAEFALSSAKGHAYSFSKRFEEECVYLPDCQPEELDYLLGVTPPEKHFPCYVTQGICEIDGERVDTLSIYEYTGKETNHYSTVYDKLEHALEGRHETKHIRGEGNKEFDVVKRLEKIEPLSNGRVTAVMSFKYVIVSKKLRVKE